MIVGLCRFSYLSLLSGAWRNMPAMPGKARQVLFDPERMETRFALFERYTLPSIRGQTDGDFRFVILTSRELSKPYHDRLMDATAGDRRIRVRPLPPRRTAPLLRSLFAEEFGDAGQRISFRLDDDDGLSVDFVRRLREAATARGSAAPFFVSFGSGVTVSYRDGRIEWASECSFPFLSMGLALVDGSGDGGRCVYDVNHRACFRSFDTLVLAGRPGFIRSVHAFNISEGKVLGTEPYARTTLAGIARQFRAEFPYLAAGG